MLCYGYISVICVILLIHDTHLQPMDKAFFLSWYPAPLPFPHILFLSSSVPHFSYLELSFSLMMCSFFSSLISRTYTHKGGHFSVKYKFFFVPDSHANTESTHAGFLWLFTVYCHFSKSHVRQISHWLSSDVIKY